MSRQDDDGRDVIVTHSQNGITLLSYIAVSGPGHEGPHPDGRAYASLLRDLVQSCQEGCIHPVRLLAASSAHDAERDRWVHLIEVRLHDGPWAPADPYWLASALPMFRVLSGDAMRAWTSPPTRFTVH